jgi:hypothetical protein
MTHRIPERWWLEKLPKRIAAGLMGADFDWNLPKVSLVRHHRLQEVALPPLPGAVTPPPFPMLPGAANF